jgi:putative Holliday junction resolvase
LRESPQAEHVRALGIDLGSVRIGLAVSDRSGTLASPHSVLRRARRRSEDHEAIARLVHEEGIEVVVVGLPVNMDGSEGPAARSARAEGAAIATVVSVPVVFADERRSTVAAEGSMRERGVHGSRRRESVDKVAAAFILQGWLDSREHGERGP